MRARSALSLLIILMLGGLAYDVAAQTALQEAPPKIEPERFEKDILAFEAEDRQSPPPSGAIVITGSSSGRRWDRGDTQGPDSC